MSGENRITLTAEQQNSADRLLASFDDYDIRTVLLEGGAGTGQYHLALPCGRWATSPTCFGTPTHRAAA